MNELKFYAVVQKELNDYYERVSLVGGITVQNWYHHKNSLTKYIKNMDDLVEVYNMENKESK